MSTAAAVAALAGAASRLTSEGTQEESLVEAISIVGDAAGIDRAFIWQVRPERPLGDDDLPVLRAEWCRPSPAPPPTSEPATASEPDTVWKPPSEPGVVVAGMPSMLATEWRNFLSPGARSAVVTTVGLPDGTAWVGFEDASRERAWSIDERDVLRALAALVALALARESAVESRRLMSNLVEQIPAVLYIDEIVGSDVDNGKYRTLYVTPQIGSILGISPEEWMTDDELWQHRIHPDDWDRVRKEYREYLRRGGTLVQEYRMMRPDNGQMVWVRDDCTVIADATSEARIIQGVMLDITDQKLIEEQLRTAEAKNRTLIEQIPAVVFIEPLGGASEPPYVSSSVEHVLGCSKEQWLESGWWKSHLHADDRERVLTARQELLAERVASRVEYRMVLDDGTLIWIGEVAQVVTADNTPKMLQGLLEDITSRKVAEEGLAFRASHDGLTGLPNRASFEEHLERALARAVRNRLAVAVLFMDIDGFKEVNDTLGHNAGDEVLRIVANRLSEAVRDTDLVARRGGDEFLVLLADIEPGPAG
jgi:PAS domain S-box-containing protein